MDNFFFIVGDCQNGVFAFGSNIYSHFLPFKCDPVENIVVSSSLQSGQKWYLPQTGLV